MPRYIQTIEAHHPQHEKLVKQLLREFTSPSTNLQPLILEEHEPATKSRKIYVIWDKWKDLSLEQRFDIILDAYKEAEGEEAAAEVLISSGLTAQEALALGLLPYKVESARRQDDPIPLENYRKALAAEAVHTVLGPKAKALRYARQEDAQVAAERLQKALPGSFWTVVKEEHAEE